MREITDAFSHRGRQEPDRLEESVKRLRDRQAGAMEETKRLRGLEQSQGELTRAQSADVLDLAKLQREIQAAAARLGEQSKDHRPIQNELAGAADDMGRAAESLDQRQTGPPAQEAQQSAIRRLDSLAASIEQVRKNAEQGPPGTNQSQQNSPKASNDAGNPKSNSPNGTNPAEKPSGGGAAKPNGNGQVNKPDAAAEARDRMKQLSGRVARTRREQMMQSAGEDFPPKYELRIEEYFRRLSEEKKR